jgi:CRP-like cAMP-binding protein
MVGDFNAVALDRREEERTLKKRATSDQIPNGNCAKNVIRIEKFGLDTLSTPEVLRVSKSLIRSISERGRNVSYGKGNMFFAQEEPSHGVFLLLYGSVKLYIGSPDGKSLILGFLGPGTILGVAAAILEKRYGTSAEAIAPTTAVILERDSFLGLLQENTRTVMEAAELLSRERFDLLDQVKGFGLSESAPQKLAAFLLRLRQPDARYNGKSIQLSGITQSDLAQMVGLSRETASRLLSRLTRKNVLDWKRSTLVIRNWEALERLAVATGNAAERRKYVRESIIKV